MPAPKLNIQAVDAKVNAVAEAVVALSSTVDKTVSYITNHPEAVVSASTNATVGAILSAANGLTLKGTFAEVAAEVNKAAGTSIDRAWDTYPVPVKQFSARLKMEEGAAERILSHKGSYLGSFPYTTPAGVGSTCHIVGYVFAGATQLLLVAGNTPRPVDHTGATLLGEATTSTGEVVNQTSKPVIEDVAEESAIV